MKFFIALLGIATLAACSGSSSDETEGEATERTEEKSSTLASTQTQEVDPGATILEAAKIKVGMKVGGRILTIEGKATSNFYYFENEGKLRDIVTVRLENKSTTLRPYIKVYNSERSQLFELFDRTPGANAEKALSLDPGTGLYVEVLPYDSVGAYEISAICQNAYDKYEANDDQLRPTTMKFITSIEASIMDKNDPDWYQVTPTTVGKVTISLENLSSTLRPYVKVYSASKSELIERWDRTVGAGLDFTVDLKPGEDFYIQVLPYSTNGAYRLTSRPTVFANDMENALNTDGQIAVYGVYFDTDKIFVKPESVNALTEISNLLKADSSLRLEVAGHTDDAGTDKHNKELSQGRADSVVAALIGQHGIEASRLVAKGYGESVPVAANDNASNMAKNRRVVLKKL